MSSSKWYVITVIIHLLLLLQSLFYYCYYYLLKIDSSVVIDGHGTLLFSCSSEVFKVIFQAKDHWEMDLSELLSSAEQFKEKGTEFFKVVSFTVRLFMQFDCVKLVKLMLCFIGYKLLKNRSSDKTLEMR